MAKKKKNDRSAELNQPKRFVVKTPNPHFTGERLGVFFRDGQAIVDEKTARELKQFGYEYETYPDETGQEPTEATTEDNADL